MKDRVLSDKLLLKVFKYAKKYIYVNKNNLIYNFLMFSDLYKIIRRRLFFIFRKDYVESQLKKRKGSCIHCSCCDMKFFGCYDYNCLHHDKKNKAM